MENAPLFGGASFISVRRSSGLFPSTRKNRSRKNDEVDVQSRLAIPEKNGNASKLRFLAFNLFVME